MSFVEDRKVLTREKRISTLSHYNGSLEQLKNEVKGDDISQRIRTFSQAAEDEIISAIRILSRIRQSAVIVHGALGCSAAGLYFNGDTPLQWYSTNLNERDTILGGDGQLRSAIYRAYKEQKPKVIFIVGTPVGAINNDDVNSVILELEEELDVKILFIYTDGFKTKTPATGYDIVLHALLRYVVDRDVSGGPAKEEFVNIVTISENTANLLAVVEIFANLGIPYQLLPQFSDIDSMKNAGRAKATIVLNEEEGALFAEELEEVFKIPYIRTASPIGIQGTRDFILTLAKALDIEEKAKAYIEEEEKKLYDGSEEEALKAGTVFVDANLYSLPGFLELIKSVGGKTVGIAVPYIDLQNRKYLENLEELEKETPVVIGTGQLFEKANILSKTKADYYISINTDAAFAAEQGSRPVSLARKGYYGYKGVQNFRNAIQEAGKQQKLQKLLAEKDTFYKASWLKRSSNWYVKQEVK